LFATSCIMYTQLGNRNNIMFNLNEKLNGVVETKLIKRIEHELKTTKVNSKIGADSHIATCILKALLKLGEDTPKWKRNGYETLYRDLRKGNSYISGRQLKFHSVNGDTCDEIAEQANNVFKALKINASAEASFSEGWPGFFSIAVHKRDNTITSETGADMLELIE